jgi:hypothetical protein
VPSDSDFQGLCALASTVLIDNAKVLHFSFASKFCPSIWGVFQHEFDELMFSTSKMLTLGRVYASMALLSLNRIIGTGRVGGFYRFYDDR